MEFPAVHLSIDDLEQIERLLKENTTHSEIELVLSLPGGVEQTLSSVDQIDDSFLANLDGSDSYSLSVVGDEGRCTIAGESTGTESHMLYSAGDPDWRVGIQDRVGEYLNSVQTEKSRLRGQLTGSRATGVAILSALFVGWAVSAIAPQSAVHYFPTLFDAFLFFIGSFGLLVVRYRNWVHPYIWISHDHPYPIKSRIGKLGIAALLLTSAVLIFRYLVEPGPVLR